MIRSGNPDRIVEANVDSDDYSSLTEADVLDTAQRFIGDRDLSKQTYDKIVRLLSIATYIADLCILEIEERGLLEFNNGTPSLPDARPEGLFVINALTRNGSLGAEG